MRSINISSGKPIKMAQQLRTVSVVPPMTFVVDRSMTGVTCEIVTGGACFACACRRHGAGGGGNHRRIIERLWRRAMLWCEVLAGAAWHL